jgi:anti-sigma factor ChrR (cupin superfamily)
VRYAPGSAFQRHVHALGEEFLVLEGVFSDERGDFPAGSYVRNPPGSAHSPYSKSGCEIFVKLRQMPPQERRAIDLRIDSLDTSADVLLFEADYEQVRILTLAAGRHRLQDAPLLELLVLTGGIEYAGVPYGPKSWLRLPDAVELHVPVRTRLYLKRHLNMPGSTTS